MDAEAAAAEAWSNDSLLETLTGKTAASQLAKLADQLTEALSAAPPTGTLLSGLYGSAGSLLLACS